MRHQPSRRPAAHRARWSLPSLRLPAAISADPSLTRVSAYSALGSSHMATARSEAGDRLVDRGRGRRSDAGSGRPAGSGAPSGRIACRDDRPVPGDVDDLACSDGVPIGERRRRGAVQSQAPQLGRALVDRRAHEAVREGDHRGGAFHDEARQQRVLGRREQCLTVEAGHPAGEVEIDIGSEHGAGAQQCLRLRRQSGDAEVDRLPDPLGDRRRRVPRFHTVAEEMLGELTDEQRIAVGRVAHCVDQPVGRLGAGHVGHQLDEFGPAEAVELHRRDHTPPTQFGERCGGRRRDVGRPDRSHDHHVGESLVRREEGEHRERALIGPVEVVEHHQRRTGRSQEARRRLEEQAPLDRRVGAARHERIRRTVHEPWHEATQIAQFDRHPCVEAPQRGPDRLDPRFEHAELMRRRATDQHRDALLGQFGSELVRQGGLAHTGLAGHQRDPGASGPCIPQGLQLDDPADEGPMALARRVGRGRVALCQLPTGRGGHRIACCRGDHGGSLLGVDAERIAEQPDGREAGRRATAGLERGDTRCADPRSLGESFLGQPGRRPQPSQRRAEGLRRCHPTTLGESARPCVSDAGARCLRRRELPCRSGSRRRRSSPPGSAAGRRRGGRRAARRRDRAPAAGRCGG